MCARDYQPSPGVVCLHVCCLIEVLARRVLHFLNRGLIEPATTTRVTPPRPELLDPTYRLYFKSSRHVYVFLFSATLPKEALDYL